MIDFQYREANAAALPDGDQESGQRDGTRVAARFRRIGADVPLHPKAWSPGGQAPDDYSYDHEIQADSRRYDIRIAPAGQELISPHSFVTSPIAFRPHNAPSQLNPAARHCRQHARSQMLLEAVRDPTGRVTDFTYRSANRALRFPHRGGRNENHRPEPLEAQPSAG